MNTTHRLIVAMAAQCRDMIQKSVATDSGLPAALQPKHLLWMCTKIDEHADHWPATKLHRWIGFVQCGMMANRILDLDAAKAMFDEAKIAHGGSREDQDLIDHLDPESSFEFDIGGQG